MKTIFSDKVIATLRKVPVAVWFLLLAVTCFFVECKSIIDTTVLTAEQFNAALAEQEMEISVNVTAVTVLSCIFEGLLSAAIMELIFYAAYALLIRRYCCAINKKDFSFRVRLLVIIINLILGILNLTAFIGIEVGSIVAACTGFVIPALSVAWFYEDFRKKYVPKRHQGQIFGIAAAIAVGIAFIVKLIRAIEYTVVTGTGISVFTLAAVWVDLGLTAIIGVLAYLNYRRLVKISKEPEDNALFEEKEKPNDVIFKDLGF